MTSYISNRVHDLYWNDNINCAKTILICLSELYHVSIEQQVMSAAIGLHGAGGYRAQCGLVEGGLMFIGIYYDYLGKSEEETVSACYHYAETFEEHFGSLRCFDLRPMGFTPSDPHHKCERLTCEAVEFACSYLEATIKKRNILPHLV